jgi:ubiquinone/menaquinone biosynthesis C-methylase UbiE
MSGLKIFNRYIAKQLSKPSGFGGIFVFSVMNRQNRQMYEEMARLLAVDDNNAVLDIGCGNGYMLNLLAGQFDGNFCGIDISESILKSAERYNRKFVRNGKLSFIVGNANELPFGNAVFDKVFTINTVYFWDNLNTTLAEIHRVLKPNGTFVNALYTNETLDGFPHTKFGYQRFTEEQLRGAARKAGFEANVVSIMNGKAYGVVCRRI